MIKAEIEQLLKGHIKRTIENRKEKNDGYVLSDLSMFVDTL